MSEPSHQRPVPLSCRALFGRPARRAWPLVAALALTIPAGCPWSSPLRAPGPGQPGLAAGPETAPNPPAASDIPFPAPGSDPAAPAAPASQRTGEPLPPLSRRFDKPFSEAPASRPPPAEAPVEDPLRRDGWIRTVMPRSESSGSGCEPRRAASRPGLRWRYPDLEESLLDPPDRRPDFHAALDDPHPVVAANAAILLGRSSDCRALARLVATVENRQLRLAMRCAAAEALGLLPPGDGEPVGALRRLIDRYGRFGHQVPAPRYAADLHLDLVRSLARHVDPADDVRLTDALRSPSSDVRIEALQAWARGKHGSLPTELTDLRTARDKRVRAEALHALAARRHPEAPRWLAQALGDWDMSVRRAAAAGLGQLGDPGSRKALRGLLDDRAELSRAAAVTALAESDDREAVLGAASDESWRVRQAVGEALSRYPDRAGAAIARQLLDDPSTSVPSAVLAALRKWPLEKAGPILLEAMHRDSYLVRNEAAAVLAARWPPAQAFAADAPTERRRELLDRLTQQFRRQFGFVDRQALAAAMAPRAPDSAERLSPERLAELGRLVEALTEPDPTSPGRIDAHKHLAALGPALVPSLEAYRRASKRPLPEAAYRDLLTGADRVFEALDRLTSQDASLRRRAAADLAEAGAEAPLGWLATDRLAALVAAEEDVLVWRSALAAVAADGSEPAMRIAAAGLSHPSAEVRRRACEHFARFPSPAHAPVLLPALRDSSDAVVLAAIEAIASGGRLDDAGPLEALLGHDHQSVRLAAAAALARLGRPSGAAALQRLALSGDPIIRREVAAAMGELGDPAFTADLVRMLDEGHGIRRAALEALPKVVGRDESALPAPAASLSERVDRWKRWYERRRSGLP